MGRSRSPFYSVDLIRPVIHYKIPRYAILNWVGWREFALTVLYFIGNLQTFQCTHVMSKMNALHVKKLIYKTNVYTIIMYVKFSPLFFGYRCEQVLENLTCSRH